MSANATGMKAAALAALVHLAVGEAAVAVDHRQLLGKPHAAALEELDRREGDEVCRLAVQPGLKRVLRARGRP